jgi:hypothetical protein
VLFRFGSTFKFEFVVRSSTVCTEKPKANPELRTEPEHEPRGVNREV